LPSTRDRLEPQVIDLRLFYRPFIRLANPP